MDAYRNAAAGDSRGDDRDEGDCRGAGDFRERNCYYAGYRYDLSRGWNTGEWNCDCKLAGVYDGDWPGGAERDDIADDYRRGFKSAVGAECRIDADGDLLYRGVSPG